MQAGNPQKLRLTRGAARRQAGAADPGSPHLGHRPLQLPLRLLHAEGGLRPRLSVPPPRRAPDLRGDRAPRPDVRRPGRREDPHHGRGTAAAPRSRDPAGDAGRDPGRRPDADDERRPAGAQGAGAQGRRTRAHHGQPGLARRRDLPHDERRRLPGRARACRHRRGPRGRPRAREGERRRQARRERGRDPPDGPSVPRHGRGPALHRVHGRRAHQRLAARRRRPGERDRRRDRRRAPARARRACVPRRGRQPLALPGRERRDRGHRLGHAAVLRRLHGRASRRRASCTPASSPPGATTCARWCGAGPPTPTSPRRSRPSGPSATTATPSCAPPRPPTCPRSRCPTSAVEREDP